jgi:L-methionine (R)-S-oxide reductase
VVEEINIKAKSGKQEKYLELLPQVEALVGNEQNMVANMANITAALKQTFDFFWVGFYVVDGNTLVLGPFQGPVACTRIERDRGVCGKVWRERQTEVVANVDDFPDHIACNSASRSEIVVPGIDAAGNLQFVLDVDSDEVDEFDETDKKFLEKIVSLLF